MEASQKKLGMSLQDIGVALTRISYKPGWELKLDPNGRDSRGPLLRIDRLELDATRSVAGKIQLNSSTMLPSREILDETLLRRFVYQALCELEMHELDEWFQIDGVAPYYPHPRM